MPFYALIEPVSGEIVDVVVSLDAPTEGLLVVELPAPGDNVEFWKKWQAKKGGAPGTHMHLDREESGDSKDRSSRGRERLRDAEAFFARLDHECDRSDASGAIVGLLLFDLAPPDRAEAQQFVLDTFTAHRQEILSTDLVARVRDHLVVVLMPNVDAYELNVEPLRGFVTPLTYPRDSEVVAALRRREHPLLRRSMRRV